MPETARKVGPFTTRQWAIGGVLGGALWYGIRWYRNRTAASSTAAAGGGTIPTSTTGTPAAGPSTIAAWLQSAMAYGTDPIATFNAATNWLNGNCVDSGGYNGLTAAIQALGLPPGFSMPPVLTVCANGNSGSGSNPSSSGGGTGQSTGGGSQQNTPPPAIPVPTSPNGTPAPTVGSAGQPLPGNPNFAPPGSISIPLPAPGQGWDSVTSALGIGQTGVAPNGLRITRTGPNSYVYS